LTGLRQGRTASITMDGPDRKSPPAPEAGDARRERLAKALRENLRRRKGAPPTRAGTPPPDDHDDEIVD
jgi:hypothetical protein